MGVAIYFSNAGIVIVAVMVKIANNVVTVAVLNILGGKLLVTAVDVTGWILAIDVHLQQDGEIKADLQRSANPELRWSMS